MSTSAQPETTIRPGVEADVDQCFDVFFEAITHYLAKINSADFFHTYRERIHQDVTRLFRHLLTTGAPSVYNVAVDTSTSQIVGFGNGYQRPPALSFACFIFVLPTYQGGLGTRLFELVFNSRPVGATTALVADSAQPISNALYARYGVIGRVVLQNLRGAPELAKMQTKRTGLRAVRIVEGEPKEGEISLDSAIPEITKLDEQVIGYTRPQDIPFFFTGKPLAHLYLDAEGKTVGYGFARPGSGCGPVLAVNPSEFPGIVLDTIVRAVEAGKKDAEKPDEVACAVWMPSGELPELFTDLLKAGMKISGFPQLLAFDAPGGARFRSDLKRYMINGPGFL